MTDNSTSSNIGSKYDVMLSADPEVAFFSPGGGKSEHMLVNTSDARLAVKIRCSNNTHYRVHPVCLFIEAGQCKNLSVTRLAGPARTDKLVVQYLECSKADCDPRKLFADVEKAGTPTSSLRIALKMDSCNPARADKLSNENANP